MNDAIEWIKTHPAVAGIGGVGIVAVFFYVKSKGGSTATSSASPTGSTSVSYTYPTGTASSGSSGSTPPTTSSAPSNPTVPSPSPVTNGYIPPRTANPGGTMVIAPPVNALPGATEFSPNQSTSPGYNTQGQKLSGPGASTVQYTPISTGEVDPGLSYNPSNGPFGPGNGMA